MVNTHEHFDHTFGNATFRAAYGDVPIHAHETAAEQTVPAGERVKASYDLAENRADEHRDEVLATDIVAADTTFSSAVALDLGDRQVELVHPGGGTPRATSWCACPTRTCCLPATSSRNRCSARVFPASVRTAIRWSGRSASTSSWA